MNIFVITVSIGWLIITGDSKSYKYVRLTVALLALIGIAGAILEQLDNKPAFLNKFITLTTGYAHWAIICLAGVVLIKEVFKNRSSFAHNKAW